MQRYALEVPLGNEVFGVYQPFFEKYGYSPAVRAGGLLFISGQVGVRPDNTVPDSIAEQTKLALQRTEEILKIAGLALDDLVEVVSYHVDLEKNIAEFLPVKERFTRRPFSRLVYHRNKRVDTPVPKGGNPERGGVSGMRWDFSSMFCAVDCTNGQLPVPPLPASGRFTGKFLSATFACFGVVASVKCSNPSLSSRSTVQNSLVSATAR